MGFSEAVHWWQDWHLRILVLFSLFLQYFLFMSSPLRKSCVPSLVRFFIWLAYLGSDAIALYALAALFNHPRDVSLGVKVLWAPILLVHLGGQDGITAYNIEDNELWKRHVLTATSQVTIAVYIFWRSWSHDKIGNYLAAAILLFFPGILKCILKPWDLKRVSINSLVESSGSIEKNGGINSLEDFVRAANNHFRLRHGHQPNKEEVDERQPYDLFIDLAFPYSYRLRCLKYFVQNPTRLRHLVKSGLSSTFDRLYTKELVLHHNFSGLSSVLLNCIDLVRVVAAACMLAVIVLIPIRQGNIIDTDVWITYILLGCTLFLEYLIPIVIFINRMNQWFGDQQRWPDQIAQYNLIWYLARNKRWKTKMVRMLATLLVCSDYLDQHWCMPSSKSSSDIFKLVHAYLAKAWTDRHIKDMGTYRAFNDNRGQWTLEHSEDCGNLKWSIQKPFDESVILWHLATDFCFHDEGTARSFPASRAAASRSREISNYMAYLLFINPEMLMTGARRSLFRAACSQLQETLKVISQPDGERSSRLITSQEENELAWKVTQNIQQATGRDDLSIVHEAWKLSNDLMRLRRGENDVQMWIVIQRVWVEMLCFSAARCRGYLHAKSLGQGGEYLSYIWLLQSYMGMETLGERMQRTTLQEEGRNNNVSATTAEPPLTSTGDTASATAAAPGGYGDGLTAASITTATEVPRAPSASSPGRRDGAAHLRSRMPSSPPDSQL